jgi:hypothetical protein
MPLGLLPMVTAEMDRRYDLSLGQVQHRGDEPLVSIEGMHGYLSERNARKEQLAVALNVLTERAVREAIACTDPARS